MKKDNLMWETKKKWCSDDYKIGTHRWFRIAAFDGKLVFQEWTWPESNGDITIKTNLLNLINLTDIIKDLLELRKLLKSDENKEEQNDKSCKRN